MAKKLQLRGGTTSQHSSFTGAVREVTVDTDKDVVVVHDGSTAGGFPTVKSGSIANADIDASAAIATSKLSGAVTSITSHGLAASATTDTTSASNISSGTLPNARLSAVPTSSLTGAVTSIGSHGLATSATTDTTNASNIGSGTLPNGRLSSVPTSSLTGAVTSIASHGLATSATTDTTNASNIGSGTLSNSRLSGVGILDTASNWTKGQRAEITALSDGATITPDMNDSNNFSVTLGGNRTLANPSNLTAGQSGSVFITQDGTGSRTLGYGSYWDWADGEAPTLTTTASATDRIDYVVRTTTSIHAVCTLAYS